MFLQETILYAIPVLLIAALYAYFKTPPELRNPSKAAIAANLEKEIASGRAILVEASGKKSMLPWLAFLLLLPPIYLIHRMRTGHDPCQIVLGYRLDWLLIVAFCYYIPLVLFMVAVPKFLESCRSLCTGYFPPVSRNSGVSYIARRGVAPMIQAVLQMLLLPIAVIWLYVVINTLGPKTHGISYGQYVAQNQCAHNNSLQARRP